MSLQKNLNFYFLFLNLHAFFTYSKFIFESVTVYTVLTLLIDIINSERCPKLLKIYQTIELTLFFSFLF